MLVLVLVLELEQVRVQMQMQALVLLVFALAQLLVLVQARLKMQRHDLVALKLSPRRTLVGAWGPAKCKFLALQRTRGFRTRI